MALSRVTTWSAGQTLTAAALNAEFDNIINGAASLINGVAGSFTTVVASGNSTMTQLTLSGALIKSVTNTITAGSTQTQAGATALTKDINRVTVSGTNGDGVKLPAAVVGAKIEIINDDAAQTIQIWPATGDAIDGGSANAVDANALAAGGDRTYFSVDSTNWYTKSSDEPAASATVAGIVELATDAETITGTDTARAVTPANIQAKVAGAAAKGIVELATDAETITGTDTARAVTPANLQAKVTGLTVKGIVELATEAEHVTGTDEARASTVLGTASVVQDGKWTYVAGAGSADVHTITLVPAVGAYVAGQRFQFLPTADNTGACTLNVSGLGAKNIKKSDGAGALANPAAADLDTVLVADVIYDGTQFVLQNPGVVATGTVAVSGGGTGATSLTDGGVLLGSGTNAVTAMAVLADSTMIVGDGSTDPVAESGATLRTSIGVGTGDTLTLNGLIFDNETLDVYDEGTFSPILRPNSVVFDSVTYDVGGIYYGFYVIIGHTCYFEWSFRTDSITKGSGSGPMMVYGLPVAPHGQSDHYRPYLIKAYGPFDGEFPSMFVIHTNQAYGALQYNADTTTGSSNTAISDIGTGANENWITSCGTYNTD
jgi:hypothetical protein